MQELQTVKVAHTPMRTPDAPSFAPLTPTSSLFWEQTLDLATGVSRLRVR